MSAEATSGGAAVRIPFPPALYLGALLVTLALNTWVVALDLPSSAALTAVGVLLVVAGEVLAFTGVATMLRHHTTLAPSHQVSAMVTSGPYRLSRNPMYAGLTVAYAGVALWMGTWWPLLALPVCVMLTQRLVIEPEEVYLGGLFGAHYADYQRRVRRWL
jgi:protein-S-isoprenylcysteine O-methyltransferase Ste14